MRSRSVRGTAALLSAALAALLVPSGGPALAADNASAPPASPASAGCQLGNGVQHVIHLTFDNVHFFRDNPNVPSDLELMPHLKQFLESNGTVLSNMHTPLIAHTAQDSLAIYTGLYGDRHGMPVSNSYKTYNPDGSTSPDGSFVYWTSPVYNSATKSANPNDASPSMVYSPTVPAKGNPADKVTPAPWVPFTRAGCSVGDFSTANMVLENVGLDIPTVFGAGSPEAQQLNADPSSFKDPETADYVGVAVHCATADAVCESAQATKFGESVPSPSATPDRLPDEPAAPDGSASGYDGFKALFGHRYVAPQLGAGTPNVVHNGFPVTNAAGNLVALDGHEIRNSFAKQAGFPGFNPLANESLAYMADMQEAGIPVTYGYISDLHERKPGTSGCTTAGANTGFALGPGDTCYVANAAAYDTAFQQFFQRLAADGITPANTEFVINSEENDHFAGANVGRASTPTPADCNGGTKPCTYPAATDGSPPTIGELSANLPGLLATQTGNVTPFDVEPQGASIYVHGQPAAADPSVRQLERDTANITADNPYSGEASQKIVNYQAGALEQRILHLETADPLRTPTYSLFPKGDYFFSQGPTNCSTPCVSVFSRFAWNHGYYAPDIDITWSAFVGPNVKAGGIDGPGPAEGPTATDPNGTGTVPQFSRKGTWADETDIRPTLLALVGLKDDYRSDGRVVAEILDNPTPATTRTRALGTCYKQLNSSVGLFGTATLQAESVALAGGTGTDDTRYRRIEAALTQLASSRDALAEQIKHTLNRAAVDQRPPDNTTTLVQNVACTAEIFLAQRLAANAGRL